jgi:hypothetical protein
MQTNKLQKVTTKKIKKISGQLLRLRTILILQKRKLNKREESVQKYMAEKEFILYDEFVSGMELEFKMCKYLLQHTDHK